MGRGVLLLLSVAVAIASAAVGQSAPPSPLSGGSAKAAAEVTSAGQASNSVQLLDSNTEAEGEGHSVVQDVADNRFLHGGSNDPASIVDHRNRHADDGGKSSATAQPLKLQRGAKKHRHGLHIQAGMLFRRKALFPGAILPEGTKFGGDSKRGPKRFAFKADAEEIPFAYKDLRTILKMFSIPSGSKKAQQVASTLRTCEAESHEAYTCATSMEAAMDFAADSLGTRNVRAVVSTVHGAEEAARYVVAPNGIRRIGKAEGQLVPCHPMAYPYLVYYCHRPADVEAFLVELTAVGEKQPMDGATAVAMCHSNTTGWDDRYFDMLNATRGETICHYMPQNYLLWLPAAGSQ